MAHSILAQDGDRRPSTPDSICERLQLVAEFNRQGDHLEQTTSESSRPTPLPTAQETTPVDTIRANNGVSEPADIDPTSHKPRWSSPKSRGALVEAVHRICYDATRDMVRAWKTIDEDRTKPHERYYDPNKGLIDLEVTVYDNFRTNAHEICRIYTIACLDKQVEDEGFVDRAHIFCLQFKFFVETISTAMQHRADLGESELRIVLQDARWLLMLLSSHHPCIRQIETLGLEAMGIKEWPEFLW